MIAPLDWDEDKALENLRKHGISFEEAGTVFLDPLSITIADRSHSGFEHRFLDIGASLFGRLIVVSYTERNEKIRIISARQPTRAERRQYEENG